MHCGAGFFEVAAFLLFVLTLVNSRSIDQASNKEDTSANKQLESTSHDTSWLPSSTSRDDWYRCHGAPCDEWERTKKKIKMLKVLAAREAEGAESGSEEGRDPESTLKVMDNIDSAAEKYKIDDSDDIDGCIWLTEEQADEMLREKGVTNEMMGENHVIHKRTVDRQVASGAKRWSMPIDVSFDGHHNEDEQAIIHRAMQHIEERTCVKFNTLATGQHISGSSVLFTKASTGCHSYVGRTGYQRQQVNLQAACLYNFGTPVHELLHMLGLWHEMQRSDRDQYINVLHDNIGVYRNQFFTRNTDNQVLYDPSSVLHYSGRDGSVSYRLNSMETKNPLYQHNMGQRVEMSFLDAQSINQVYCADSCTGTSLPEPCQRGGYQHPNHCERCLCPPGFSGRFCEQLAPSNRQCGGLTRLDSSNPQVYIESPGYTQGQYDNFTECNWQFQVAPGSQVSLEFVGEFGVYCSFNHQCFHWVEVQYEHGKNTQGPRFCCRDRPADVIVSESNEMTVLLRANYDVKDYNRRGFRARVQIVPGDGPAPTVTTTQRTTSTTATTTTATSTTTTTSTTTAPTTTTSIPTTTTRRQDGDSDDCVKVDLTIALDSSGSVGRSNWTKLREFTKDIIGNFRLSSVCAQTSVISIGTRGYVESHLNENYNDMNRVIDSLRWRDEWTNTASALSAMTTSVYTSSNGARDDAINVGVIVMDGPSNRDHHLTIPNAQEARSTRGLNFIVIGVSNKESIRVASAEMEAIAGPDGSTFYMDGFDELLRDSFQSQIANLIKDIASGNMNSGNRPQTTTTSTTTTRRPASSTTTTTTTTTTQPPVQGMDEEFSCNFENDNNQPTWCGISQSRNDHFDWTITNKKTPSDETGAERAHSGDYYIFIEASNPRTDGDIATIELPAVNRGSTYCLSFAYHMYGHHVDTLFVNKLSSNGDKTQVWSRHGDSKSRNWHFASFDLNLSTRDKISFSARRGGAFSGDIGLDTVQLKQGSC